MSKSKSSSVCSPYKEYYLDPNIFKKHKINKKICVRQQARQYFLLNYEKQYTTFDNYEAANYRSVVFSHPEKKLLCFSPPRSIESENWGSQAAAPPPHPMEATEVIEGIMINLFYDRRISKWEIATKSGIGGLSRCPSSPNRKTFYRMFLDALKAAAAQELNHLPMLEHFPRWFSYSFVLRHPEYPMILPVEKPEVFLVAMYRISGNTAQYIPRTIYESMSIFKNLEGVILFPKEYPEIESALSLSKPYDVFQQMDFPLEARAGIMLINTVTGERVKWENPVHLSVQKMKSIDPFPQYLYFCLRRVRHGMMTAAKPPLMTPLGQMLENYPYFRKSLHKIDEEFRLFVQNVYDAYVELFIRKNRGTTLLEKHAIHARKIHHMVYLPRISVEKRERKAAAAAGGGVWTRPNPFWINKQEVYNYFDRMEPREVLYIVNEDRRNDGEFMWKT
jgi:hypothetical protein